MFIALAILGIGIIIGKLMIGRCGLYMHIPVRAGALVLGSIGIWYGIRLHTGGTEIKCKRKW